MDVLSKTPVHRNLWKRHMVDLSEVESGGVERRGPPLLLEGGVSHFLFFFFCLFHFLFIPFFFFRFSIYSIFYLFHFLFIPFFSIFDFRFQSMLFYRLLYLTVLYCVFLSLFFKAKRPVPLSLLQDQKTRPSSHLPRPSVDHPLKLSNVRACTYIHRK